MKTKLLALGFSLAFLIGNAVNGEQRADSKGPVYTLEPFVVHPHMVKLLNDQKLDPVDFDAIVHRDVEEIIEENRQIQLITMIAFEMEVIHDVPLVAASKF